jgi:hypothetical protein
MTQVLEEVFFISENLKYYFVCRVVLYVDVHNNTLKIKVLLCTSKNGHGEITIAYIKRKINDTLLSFCFLYLKLHF